MRLTQISSLTALALLLCACGGGTGSGGSGGTTSQDGGNSNGQGGTPTTSTYTVGGTVSGLSANGMVLTDNGGDNLTVSAGATSFTFPTALKSGATYNIAVSSQPTGVTCTVASGSGTIGTSNVSSVQITCTAATGHAVSVSILYSFQGNSGADTHGDFLRAADGTIYGVTPTDGQYGAGMIFTLDITTKAITPLYSFVPNPAANQPADGTVPQGTLAEGVDGTLYGLTKYGGTYGGGTIFAYNPSTKSEMVVYSFGSTSGDNYNPIGTLVAANDGNVYGVTDTASYAGTLFRYNPVSKAYTLLHSFGGTGDGSNPVDGMVQANDGNLYGVTGGGGATSGGTIFEYHMTTGVESVVFSFGTNGGDFWPAGRLILGSDGNLYGVTRGYTLSNQLYKFDVTTRSVSMLYTFGSAGDVYTPMGHLVQSNTGAFYGFAWHGGADSYGGIFEYDPASNNEDVVYSLTDAWSAYGSDTIGFIQASDGNLYGMTDSNGTYGAGTVIEVDLQ